MDKYYEKMSELNFYFSEDHRYQPQEEDIDAFEREVGFQLPKDYACFLLNYGGSAFEDYVVFPFDEHYPKDDYGLIDVFLGILPGHFYDLLKGYQTYKKRIPPNFFPIALDPGGNIICLSTASQKQGFVYFWDHEEEEELEENQVASFSNLYLIATSFDKFIFSLQIDSEDDQDEEGE